MRAALVLVLCLSGCLPPACSDDRERAVRRDVATVVEDDGLRAAAAHRRLVARGADAIPMVETGFYAANPAARVRLVKVLADIGAPEARPLLEHLVKRDPDPLVREAAEGAISTLR